jgi:hypothetical protein
MLAEVGLNKIKLHESVHLNQAMDIQTRQLFGANGIFLEHYLALSA